MVGPACAPPDRRLDRGIVGPGQGVEGGVDAIAEGGPPSSSAARCAINRSREAIGCDPRGELVAYCSSAGPAGSVSASCVWQSPAFMAAAQYREEPESSLPTRRRRFAALPLIAADT